MQTDTLSNELKLRTISDDEIADMRKVSRATVRRWAALGLLPPKVGPGRKAPRNRDAVLRALCEGK
jgi:transposase